MFSQPIPTAFTNDPRSRILSAASAGFRQNQQQPSQASVVIHQQSFRQAGHISQIQQSSRQSCASAEPLSHQRIGSTQSISYHLPQGVTTADGKVISRIQAERIKINSTNNSLTSINVQQQQQPQNIHRTPIRSSTSKDVAAHHQRSSIPRSSNDPKLANPIQHAFSTSKKPNPQISSSFTTREFPAVSWFPEEKQQHQQQQQPQQGQQHQQLQSQQQMRKILISSQSTSPLVFHQQRTNIPQTVGFMNNIPQLQLQQQQLPATPITQRNQISISRLEVGLQPQGAASFTTAQNALDTRGKTAPQEQKNVQLTDVIYNNDNQPFQRGRSGSIQQHQMQPQGQGSQQKMSISLISSLTEEEARSQSQRHSQSKNNRRDRSLSPLLIKTITSSAAAQLPSIAVPQPQDQQGNLAFLRVTIPKSSNFNGGVPQLSVSPQQMVGSTRKVSEVEAENIYLRNRLAASEEQARLAEASGQEVEKIMKMLIKQNEHLQVNALMNEGGSSEADEQQKAASKLQLKVIESLTKENEQLRRDLNALKSEIDEQVNSKYENKEEEVAELASLENTIEALVKENEKISALLETKLYRCEILETQLDSMTQNYTAFTRENEELRSKRLLLEQESSRQKARILVFEEKLRISDTSIERLEDNLRRQTTMIDSLTEEKVKLSSSVKELDLSARKTLTSSTQLLSPFTNGLNNEETANDSQAAEYWRKKFEELEKSKEMKEPIRVKDFENQIANLIEENMKLNNLLSSQFSSIAANVGSQRYHSHNPPPFLQMPYK